MNKSSNKSISHEIRLNNLNKDFITKKLLTKYNK